MSKVLITGGCGFVGVNLAHMLHELGREIRVIDNQSLGSRAHLEPLPVDFIDGDIRDADAVDRAVKGVDAVVHLAADTRVIPSIEKPAFNFENNVVGTFNILEAMRRHEVPRIVAASTGGAILGEAEPPVHEAMVAEPISPYGASKLACEGYLSAFAGSYGIDGASLRFSNVYGPRSFHKGSVVAHFFKRILAGEELVVYGDGTQKRDYIFVEDLCEGIVSAIERGASGVIQLGTGTPTSVDALIAEMRGVVEPQGYPVRVRYEDFRPGEIKHTWCRIDKARERLDFDPDTPLSEGLAYTWAWFVENRARFAA